MFFIDNIYSNFELILPYKWLIGHTVTEDLSMTGKSIRKWEHLLPSEELEAMKNLIILLLTHTILYLEGAS